MQEFIRFEDVVKTYRMGEIEVRAADQVSFRIMEGEFAVVSGPSGAGKTTVLNMLGGMDRCDGGRITVGGAAVSRFSDRELTAYRRHGVGFVFQFYNLISNLTALENVELAAQICRNPLDAAGVLREVGLADRMGHFPSQLSGGEQQRVSIARALAKNARLLLCDEPTGALDYATGKVILSLLHRSCRERGITVILITHNQAVAPMADRVIRMKNGRIADITVNPAPTPAERIEW